jgi:hypothetical protein
MKLPSLGTSLYLESGALSATARKKLAALRGE